VRRGAVYGAVLAVHVTEAPVGGLANDGGLSQQPRQIVAAEVEGGVGGHALLPRLPLHGQHGGENPVDHGSTLDGMHSCLYSNRYS